MERKSQLIATFNSARSNMLLMLVLTTVNVVLTIAEANLMFMFTAYFPYIAASYANGLLAFIKPLVLIVGVALPLVLTLLCWIFTGKGKYGWMNLATIIFALDTVFMVIMFINIGFEAELLVDYIIGTLFHAYVLWALIKGMSAGKKLKNGDFYDDTAVSANTAAGTAAIDSDAVAVQENNQILQ